MTRSIERVAEAARTLGRAEIWDSTTKASKVSDDLLLPLLAQFFNAIGKQRIVRKRDLHELVEFVPEDELEYEITEKLDAIAAVATSVEPPGLP